MYGKSIHALGCPAFAAIKLGKEELNEVFDIRNV
jgi:hypothetical protein